MAKSERSPDVVAEGLGLAIRSLVRFSSGRKVGFRAVEQVEDGAEPSTEQAMQQEVEATTHRLDREACMNAAGIREAKATRWA